MEERVNRCLPHSAVELSKENIDELITCCRRVEQLDDVRGLVHLLCPVLANNKTANTDHIVG